LRRCSRAFKGAGVGSRRRLVAGNDEEITLTDILYLGLGVGDLYSLG
jgi:hypothetical protein